MEFQKSVIHMDTMGAQKEIQAIVDEDMIVPDSKPDIDRLIAKDGKIEATIEKKHGGRLALDGVFRYRMLYGNEKFPGNAYFISGEFQVNEVLSQTDGTEEETGIEGGYLDCDFEIEDFKVSIINGRKYNIKAIINAKCRMRKEEIRQITTKMEGMDDICMKQESLQVLELTCSKKDIYRIREDINIPKNKPNIEKILWDFAGANGLTYKLGENQIEIEGQLDTFVLYQPADEDAPQQWLEQVIPFRGVVEAQGISSEMVHNICGSLGKWEIVIKEDEDGEPRMLSVDAVIELKIRTYQDTSMSVLKDVYSTRNRLVLQKEPCRLERLVLKNSSKVKVSHKEKVEEKDGGVLSVCAANPQILLEDIQQTPKGMELSGIIRVNIMYVSTNDVYPISEMTEEIPFSHLMEINEKKENYTREVYANMDSIQAGMSGQNEIELKAVMELVAFIKEPVLVNSIQQIDVQQITDEERMHFPCMTGYVVQEHDDLWEIAKENHTTIETIRELNGLDEKELVPGQKIILLEPSKELL